MNILLQILVVVKWIELYLKIQIFHNPNCKLSDDHRWGYLCVLYMCDFSVCQMQKSCCVFFRSFSGFYVTSVLFAQKKPNFLWMAFLQWPRSETNNFEAYCISWFVSLVFFCECIFQWKTTWFCFDSSFHFCPSILQRCPTTLLGYSFLPLFVMQIFQQQCSFLVTAPVSCRKPAIVFIQVLNVFFYCAVVSFCLCLILILVL